MCSGHNSLKNKPKNSSKPNYKHQEIKINTKNSLVHNLSESSQTIAGRPHKAVYRPQHANDIYYDSKNKSAKNPSKFNFFSTKNSK